MAKVRNYFNQIALLSITALSTLFLGGCPGPEIPTSKDLQDPLTESLHAARELRDETPGSRVFFSQNTGRVLWVDGGPMGLATGRSVDRTEATRMVTQFIEAHPKLFRIDTSTDTIIGNELRSGWPGQLMILKFFQQHRGVFVKESYGIAIFGPSTKLLSIQARLVPTSEINDDNEDQGSWSVSHPLVSVPIAGATPVLVRGNGNKYTLHQEKAGQEGNVKFTRLFNSEGTLIEEVRKIQFRVIRKTLDPESGEYIESDETPSNIEAPPENWARLGQRVETQAHDDRGELHTDVPSTRTPTHLVMGFNIPGTFTGKSVVTIADSFTHSRTPIRESGQESAEIVPIIPMATQASQWTDEIEYTGDLETLDASNLRDATLLSKNILKTIQWFQELRHSSWDGKSASFHAGIRGTGLSMRASDFNAYGSEGFMMIGDKRTETTHQSLAECLAIVAHEFTHSVISATANFTYKHESGALNEALADIFGKSVENFQDPRVGHDIGHPIRNLQSPSEFDDPEKYSEYRVYQTHDLGGVHTNSGIMNRAITQVILGGDSQAGLGSIPVASLILESLKELPYSPDTTLEEFAANLSAYCRARLRKQTLLPEQGTLCERLEASFSSTELLDFSPDTTH